MQVNSQIPGLREANRIMADIKRLGIKDVELMYDKQLKMWAVMQVLKPSGQILLLNDPGIYKTEPTIMFWIKNSEDGTYRTPSEQDLSDIVAIVSRSQKIFHKGSDWMIDQMESAEKATYEDNRKKQSEKIRSYAPRLKKAIKEGNL